MGCLSARRKEIPTIEMWRIDSSEMILYRQLENALEEVIRIKDNKSMDHFLVIDQREYLKWITSIYEYQEGRICL